MSKRKYLFTGLGLFAVASLFSLFGIANTQDWGGDFSQYLAQTRAIVEGNVNEWFIRNSFIIDHSSNGLGAHAYPWLTSILIAPIYAIWGINYVPYQVFMSACFAITIIALYILLIKRNVNHQMVLVICSTVIINASFLTLTKQVRSDIPCLMFTVLTWLMLDKYINYRNISNALLVGIFAFIAFATRTMALALMTSLAVVDIRHSIIEVKNKAITTKSFIIISLPYFTFLILYIILSFILPKGGSTYLDYFSLDAKYILSNAIYYCKEVVSLFSQEVQRFQGLPAIIRTHDQVILLVIAVLMIPSIMVFIHGMIKRIKKFDHLSFYLIIMLVMLCIYNYRQGTRFIISLFPIILLFCYYGIKSAKEHIKESNRETEESDNRNIRSRHLLLRLCSINFALVLICSMMFGGANTVLGKTGSAKAETAANSESAIAAYTYINDHLDQQDVVLFFKPRVLCLYTKVLAFRNKIDLPETIRNADYILYYSGDNRFDEYIQNNTDALTQEFSNEQFSLYKIDNNTIEGNNNE